MTGDEMDVDEIIVNFRSLKRRACNYEIDEKTNDPYLYEILNSSKSECGI